MVSLHLYFTGKRWVAHLVVNCFWLCKYHGCDEKWEILHPEIAIKPLRLPDVTIYPCLPVYAAWEVCADYYICPLGFKSFNAYNYIYSGSDLTCGLFTQKVGSQVWRDGLKINFLQMTPKCHRLNTWFLHNIFWEEKIVDSLTFFQGVMDVGSRMILLIISNARLFQENNKHSKTKYLCVL